MRFWEQVMNLIMWIFEKKLWYTSCPVGRPPHDFLSKTKPRPVIQSCMVYCSKTNQSMIQNDKKKPYSCFFFFFFSVLVLHWVLYGEPLWVIKTSKWTRLGPVGGAWRLVGFGRSMRGESTPSESSERGWGWGDGYHPPLSILFSFLFFLWAYPSSTLIIHQVGGEEVPDDDLTQAWMSLLLPLKGFFIYIYVCVCLGAGGSWMITIGEMGNGAVGGRLIQEHFPLWWWFKSRPSRACNQTSIGRKSLWASSHTHGFVRFLSSFDRSAAVGWEVTCIDGCASGWLIHWQKSCDIPPPA